MTSRKDKTPEKELVENVVAGLAAQEKSRNAEPLEGNENDAIAADSEAETQEVVTTLSWSKNFRYTPSLVASDVLQRVCTNANIDKNDAVSLGLMLIQTASYEQIMTALQALMLSKAQDVYISLQK